ncbi:MAG TPA: hypothetical protein VHZ24_15255 [Pirellulales bacterium]|jgi:hypothetical protein|nr:hypothetical protein [Pirellulales bacterium]
MARNKRTRKKPQPQPAQPRARYASIFPGSIGVARFGGPPAELVDVVEQLEAQLRLPVWLLLQDSLDDENSPFRRDSFNMLGDYVASAFFDARHEDLRAGQKVALLIDSNGGMARPAYELAMLLRRHCGGFTAVIPRHAKSAATLLSLGADEIVMNAHAELGPLDAQMFDPDREDSMSGLDEVQSLERLHAFAMKAVDEMMLLMLRRTRKKTKSLLPVVSEFVAKLTQPMFQGVDVVRYTQMSRALKVASEYGKRLLRQGYGEDAERIANRLVEDYPEHGFPIYPDEARELGLRITHPSGETSRLLEMVTRHLHGLNLIGRIT